MEQDYAPIDPFARNRKRLSTRAWIGVGLLAYVGFVATCFYMESFARERFKVPSKADIAAVSDRTRRIHMETARINALDDMRSWRPYVVYSTTVGVIALGGSAAATIFAAIGIWRGFCRTSIVNIKAIVVGVMLVMLASIFLFAWPSIVAERRFEATRTSASEGA